MGCPTWSGPKRDFIVWKNASLGRVRLPHRPTVRPSAGRVETTYLQTNPPRARLSWYHDAGTRTEQPHARAAATQVAHRALVLGGAVGVRAARRVED